MFMLLIQKISAKVCHQSNSFPLVFPIPIQNMKYIEFFRILHLSIFMCKNQKICYETLYYLQKKNRMVYKILLRMFSNAIFIGNGIFPNIKIADDVTKKY